MKQDELTSSCPVCGSRRVVEWRRRCLDRRLESSDLHITDYRYGVTLGLMRCRDCQFIFACGDEMMRLGDLYSQLADPEYERTLDSRQLQMQWILDQVLALKPEAKSLLDVGAAAGSLVASARERGLKAIGVDPSGSLVSFGKQRYGVDLRQGFYPHPTLQGETFDLVFLVDVIEHVADPVSLVSDCRDALSPGGFLIVLTPDVGSLAARLFRKRWWHFRLAHVGYFCRHTLDFLADHTGLMEVARFRAKWFFRIGYLAHRVGRYLPVSRINCLGEPGRALHKLYSRIVPLNLYDSWVVVWRRS